MKLIQISFTYKITVYHHYFRCKHSDILNRSVNLLIHLCIIRIQNFTGKPIILHCFFERCICHDIDTFHPQLSCCHSQRKASHYMSCTNLRISICPKNYSSHFYLITSLKIINASAFFIPTLLPLRVPRALNASALLGCGNVVLSLL